MFVDAPAATAYRTATMLSESPDLDWIRRGWRGLRTYIGAAVRALERGDLEARATACRKASELFVLLRGITEDGEDRILGSRLAAIYDRLHIDLIRASAAADKQAFEEVTSAISALERDFGQAGSEGK